MVWSRTINGKNEITVFSEKLINLSELYNLKYSANIITNGVLLKKDYLEELILKAQIYKYQITIDGLKETHDARRFTKGGKGSYDVILKNIKKATENKIFIENNCKILIRVNIDKNNYKDSSEFIRRMAELNIQKYVSINFAPIVDWGGSGASKQSLTKSDFADLEIDWFLETLKHNFEIPEILPTRGPACMIVNPTSEVYDAYGYITPCYEMNYTKVYENSNHIIGNLNTSEQFNNNSPLRKWHDMLRDNKYPCSSCKYLPVCGGSCPKDWYKGEFTCPTLKYNLKDKMLLKFLSKKGNLKELVKL
ncbi:MAG: radical SAM protein [Cruoricaptor ignavus]|nr:radical SAM protein [Cruoricaptor ignavus]